MIGFIGWSFRWTAAFAVFLAVMAGAGYYVFFNTLQGGTYVTVPPLVGLSVTEAATRLAEEGLEMGKPESMYHPNKTKSEVISQHPAAGRVVRTGRKVYPTVSLGQEELSAPDLVKLARSEATEIIEDKGLRIQSISRVPHTAARDTVIGQDPPSGAAIRNHGEIHLLLSAGSQEAGDFMPNITGMPVDEMMRVLAPLGLTIIPQEVDYPGARLDVVLEQDPAPDTEVFEGQIVTYTVKPSQSTELPDTRFKTVVRYRMNEDWYSKEVRVEMIDRRGQRSTLYTKAPSFDEQSRATYVAGSAISLEISYVKEAVIEFYVDERKVATYRLEEGEEPKLVTDAA